MQQHAIGARLDDLAKWDKQVRQGGAAHAQPQVTRATNGVEGAHQRCGVIGVVPRAATENVTRDPNLVLIVGDHGNIEVDGNAHLGNLSSTAPSTGEYKRLYKSNSPATTKSRFQVPHCT
jgi:hypothetical protein